MAPERAPSGTAFEGFAWDGTQAGRLLQSGDLVAQRFQTADPVPAQTLSISGVARFRQVVMRTSPEDGQSGMNNNRNPAVMVASHADRHCL